MTYLWAYVAGVLTLVNPWLLPLLPIVIAAAFQGSRSGPLMLAVGLTLSFTVIGVGVTAFGHLAGIVRRSDQPGRRRGHGGVRDDPARAARAGRACRHRFAVGGPRQRRDRSVQGQGAAGQLAVASCSARYGLRASAPPSAAPSDSRRAAEASDRPASPCWPYGIGVSTVLMGLAYGSREILNSRREKLAAWMPWAKPIMGIALLLVGAAIFFHIDRMIESRLLDLMPGWLIDLSVSV